MTNNQILPKIDLSKYAGQWVVICGNDVIAHNRDLTKVNKEIKKCKTAPTIAKIPKGDTLIF